MNVMNDLKKELLNDGLFAMSLSSKELFHSNFWAWLFTRNIEYIKIFFPCFEGKENYKVKREEGNRDITVWTDPNINKRGNIKDYKRAYVVENKFKSLPDETQLERYKVALKTKFQKGVITGIKKPSFSLDGWNYVSYKHISEKIKEVAEKEEEDQSFEKELIQNYADMLDKLISCINEEANLDGKQWNSEMSDDIIELRLFDIVAKLRARAFAEWLEEKIEKDGEIIKGKNGYQLVIRDYFASKTKTSGIDIRYEKKDGLLTTDVIGIQIEGKSYRRCAQSNTSTDKEVFDNYSESGWFEEDLQYYKEKHDTSQRKQYGKYVGKGNNQYAFVYQYENIHNDENSYDSLFGKIKTDLNEAAQLI